jgi:acyl-CoA thioesterase
VNDEIQKVRDYFADDKYLTSTGVIIEEAREGYALCYMDASAPHLNAGGFVQGGALFTLADSCFAAASNAGYILAGEPKTAVGQSVSISYLNAAKPGRIYAEAKKVSGGRRMSVYEVEIRGEEGRKLCLFVGNAYTVDKK